MGEGIMGGETCELCGCTNQLRPTLICQILPEEITGQAEVSNSATVILCSNCQKELYNWYSKKVFNLAYNPETKRFRPRSPSEMVQEYQTAYKVFIDYKKGRQNIP